MKKSFRGRSRAQTNRPRVYSFFDEENTNGDLLLVKIIDDGCLPLYEKSIAKGYGQDLDATIFIAPLVYLLRSATCQMILMGLLKLVNPQLVITPQMFEDTASWVEVHHYLGFQSLLRDYVTAKDFFNVGHGFWMHPDSKNDALGIAGFEVDLEGMRAQNLVKRFNRFAGADPHRIEIVREATQLLRLRA
jgi:hypothetical protein